ncbi:MULTISPECIES: hypothetical protein [unclassified Psychrobacter]|uniref:hypothetical protein n=1 Tax=unclassified Psychrobacter TaxID=196806 RepID=UPI001D189482|nr:MULTISPECIES: hypothetical protein [unclassified Psychrobacter]
MMMSSVLSRSTRITAPLSALFAAMLSISAYAATEVYVTPNVGGTTTVIEQHSDGSVSTISASPSGITMRDGMPYSVTTINTTPRYSIRQGATTAMTLPAPVTVAPTVVAAPAVTVTPDTTVMTPVTTVAPPVITTAPAVTTVSIDTLQLQPTFSTPNVVNANTKIMKILKNSDGRDVAVPANHIAPGDVIEYRTTYTNTSAQPISNVNATVALPSNVQLVSLNSPLPTLATTGNGYQTIQQMGNTTVIQENYSGLRWDLANVTTDAPQTVVIRAKVQ